MDKLRKLFHRKAKSIGNVPKEALPPRTPPAASAKREAAVENGMEAFEGSPRKRARMSLRTSSPDLRQHTQDPRVDSYYSGSTPRESISSVTQAEPPKVEWKPMHTDLSNIFEEVAVEGRTQPQPQPRPFKTNFTNTSKQDSIAAKRRSLPPQAIFARGLKGFSDASPDEKPASSHVDGPYQSERHAMTLDDLLNRPLFDGQQSAA